MRSFVLASLLALSFNAGAQERAGGYIGGEIGNFSYEEDLSFIAPGTKFDESSTSLKIFGGYRFGDYLGLEADWRDINDLEASESVFIPDIGTLTTTVGAKIQAITIRVLGYAPLSWGSFIYGAGYFDYDADLSVRAVIQAGETVEELSESTTVSDSGGTAMLGLQWELDALDIRLTYEWFNFEDADVQQIGFGAAYRF